MPPKPRTIDEYLASVPPGPRAALEAVRVTIRSIVPAAEECISYSIPAFRLDGRIVAGFAARTNGCSYFPFSGSTLRTLGPLLRDREQTKSALHFDAAHPLPAALIRKLLEARIAEPKKTLRSPAKRRPAARGSRTDRSPRAKDPKGRRTPRPGRPR